MGKTKECQALCPWDFPGKNTGVGCHFLLHKGLIYSSLGLSIRLLECPRSMAASLSQDESSKTDSKAEAMTSSMT